MATRSRRPSLLAIVGPTASGKSDLAMKVALEFDGEIISADSRMIYKAMDIGTAKPSRADQSKVPHHLLDVVKPGQKFSAASFKAMANSAIKTIHKSHRLPILAGGSGLYIDAVLYDYGFRQNTAADPANPRHREKESYPKDKKMIADVCVVGLLPPDEMLKARISKRAQHIFNLGVLAETESLIKQFGRERLLETAGIIYPICISVLDRQLSEVQAMEQFITADWQYARRQKTWFKRNPHITWFEDSNAAYKYICSQLNK
jgi:tRNA dimethylallyltransferase